MTIDSPGAAAINFWKDPNGESCCICGEEDAEERHGELACPYDYLVSPAGYVPVRTQNSEDVGSINKFSYPKLSKTVDPPSDGSKQSSYSLCFSFFFSFLFLSPVRL